jgi:hypothetical protein
LQLESGALQAGDVVKVFWFDLLDSSGNAVADGVWDGTAD